MKLVWISKKTQWLMCVCLTGYLFGSGCWAADDGEFDPSKGFTGRVAQVLETEQYTYLEVETNGRMIWVASPRVEIKQGVDVTVPPGGLRMVDFKSKAFKRTFEEVFFIGKVIEGVMPGTSKGKTDGTELPPGHPPLSAAVPAGAPAGHPPIAGGTAASARPVSFAEELPEADTYSVSEIIMNAEKLSGKVVRVRGQVVKVNAHIMDRNWVHLQDGSGKPGSNDLTITTKDLPAEGDAVVVAGKVTVNANFGSGYRFASMLQDARIIRDPEPPAAEE